MFWRKRKSRNEDLDREIRSHLELEAKEQQANGLSAEDARYAAKRSLGNATRVKEEMRAVWGWTWLERFKQDVAYAIRTFARTPGFTAVVILTLALGIGANTAVFSAIYSVLLKPLPYRNPDRLVWITEHIQRFKMDIVGVPDFLDWQRRSHSFDTMAAFQVLDQVLTNPGSAAQIRTVYLSQKLGRILGVSPILGRDFSRAELKAGPSRPSNVAIISYGLFQHHFGGNLSVLGKTLALQGVPYTVLGVLPPDFRLPLPSVVSAETEPDAILNLNIDPVEHRGGRMGIVQVMGRLKPGVSVATARAELTSIQDSLRKQYPKALEGDLHLVPLSEHIVGNSRVALLVLWAAVGFVLLVACVSIANLTLARSAVRERETGIRASLGAGRLRLVRQFLTESTVLAFAGGAAGLLIAYCGIHLLAHHSPLVIPRLKDASLSWPVLVFTLLVCVLTALLSGIVPAIAGSRTRWDRPSNFVVRQPAQRRRLLGALIVLELAFALVLLAGAGLMLKSLWLMRSSTAAYAPEQVLSATVEIFDPTLHAPSRQAQYDAELVHRVQALPGVRAAAIWSAPATALINISGLPAPSPGSAVIAHYLVVTPDFLSASGLRLLAGRWLDARDGQSTPRVALVNVALARRFFPDFQKSTELIGRKIALPHARRGPGAPATIIGIVSGFRLHPDENPEPQILLPLSQNSSPPASGNLLVRSASDPMALASTIRRIVSKTPRVDLIHIQTLEDQLSTNIAPRRFEAILFVTFAAIGLLLAIAGVYGVLSYSVAQRTHEIGVRMALGARRSDVLEMVLARSLKLVCIGLLAGLAGSAALTRFMASMLYDVKPTDAWTLFSVSLLLAAVATLAAYLPARRASKIDPMEALRYE